MVKLRCVTLGVIQSNSYAGRSGKEYLFHKGSFTEVGDANDALGFLSIDAFEPEADKAAVVKELKKALGIREEEAPKIKDLPKAEKEVSVRTYSEAELKAMNRKQQEEIILSLGSRDFARLEKDRISHIIELQQDRARRLG